MPTVLERVKAAIVGDDANRLARRKGIKREIAKLQALDGRRSDITNQIRKLNEREAKAEGEHEKVCQPIQDRLSTLELEATELILADKEIPSELSDERGELLEQLASANSRLETEAKTIRDLRLQLEKQRASLGDTTTEASRLRGQLTAHGVANPELLAERFVVDQQVLWAEKRHRAAKEECQLAQRHYVEQVQRREDARVINSRGEVVRDPEPDEHEQRLLREVAGWEHECEAAAAAVAEAHAAREEIRQQIVAE
ncbi:MAG: hypothetical protein KDA57_21430 [Planctomycetales bacterium]|nr:hypothetical protein [Planctomycetales bacterium]